MYVKMLDFLFVKYFVTLFCNFMYLSPFCKKVPCWHVVCKASLLSLAF